MILTQQAAMGRVYAVASGGGGAGGVLFHSDWTTATGTSTAAIHDQGKTNPWIVDSSLNPPGSVISVSAAPGSPPDGITNALKITHTAGTAPSGHCGISPSLAPSMQVGDKLFYRWYLYRDFPAGAAGNDPTGWTGNHGNANGWTGGSHDDGDYWEENLCHNNDGTENFVHSFAIQLGGNTRRIYAGPSQKKDAFARQTWYMKQWGITKTGTNTMDIIDLQYWNASTATLLFDKNNLYCADGTTLLKNALSVTLPNEQMYDRVHFGTNGGGGNQGLSQDCFTYIAALCIRSDQLPGVYSGGI